MEDLGLLMAIIAGGAVFWLLTSSRWRKDMGKDISSITRAHTTSAVDNAKFSAVKNKVDSMQELADDGLTPDKVKEHCDAFDALVA